MGDLSKETFEKAGTETQMLILFDYQKATHDTLEAIKEILKSHPTNCIERLSALESKGVKNTIFAGGSGLTGGFFAVLGKKFGWW